MKYLIIILIIVIANRLFFLFPWIHIKGVFNVTDLGLVIIIIGLILTFFRTPEKFKRILNPISIFVFSYFMMVIIQVSLASFFYGQGLLHGFIAVRHQFYYLSFFLFLLLFDTNEHCANTLNFLSYIGLFVGALAVVNYFGFTLFYHKWAEGHGERSGIARAYVPAMTLIGLCFIWQLTKLNLNQNKMRSWLLTIVFYAIHVFRQTRGSLLGITAAAILQLISLKKFKQITILTFTFIFFFLALGMVTTDNILLSLFKSTYEEINQESGTWKPRLKQMEFGISEFKKHPWLGNGGEALRGGRHSVIKTTAIVYKADLGYISWLKAYGIIGVTWLIFLFSYIWKSANKLSKSESTTLIGLFTLGFVNYIILSFVTLNHLMYPEGIVAFSLVLSILVTLKRNLHS